MGRVRRAVTLCTRYTHAPGCRPARPLCRAMRRVQPSRRPCTCTAYPFPHRTTSGACRLGVPLVLLKSRSLLTLIHNHQERCSALSAAE
jgi:hypothetical protein